jgi:hypothetical protein
VRLWDAFSSAIRFPPRDRVTREAAERLLAGGHDPAHPELSRLLAAANAPPAPHELAGLDAALAAFQDTDQAERPTPATRGRRVLQPLAVAAAVSVLLAGGVAVAAETGYLPGADPPPSGQELESADVSSPSSAAARTSPGGTSGPAGTPSATASPPLGTADPTDLCRAWQHRREKGGKPMKPEELRELARAAGGEHRIPAFCAPLLKPNGKPAATPGNPTAPPGASHPMPPNPPNPPNPPDHGGKRKGENRGTTG